MLLWLLYQLVFLRLIWTWKYSRIKRASRKDKCEQHKKSNVDVFAYMRLSSDFPACFSEPRLLNRFVCRPRSLQLNFCALRCENLKPQLRLSSVSEMCSPSPNYPVSLKSANDLFPFFNLDFYFSSSSCFSLSFYPLLFFLFLKFLKGNTFEY